MPDDPRPQLLQHDELLIVVVRPQALLGAAHGGGRHGDIVVGTVVVDEVAVDMVDGSHVVVDEGRGGQRADRVGKGRADEVSLEADEDVNLRGVGGLETLGLGDVGLMASGIDG